ncbi:mu-type opioid receptor-like [Saccoglossus kowalevskii]|uniref:Mu-type opioid receptor-like n=1 Tax=Saccoglossus kowalevskii TaxID=10224 RepID=A0ABM0MM44_SACKO|nr:PREDICTED: mu-type opioid receptor-like [Saccoglossus kowalevskii]
MNNTTIDAATETGRVDFIGVIYCIIAVLGIIGNSLVCVIFGRNRKKFHSLTHYFIRHQSFIDLISSCVFLVTQIVYVHNPGVLGGVVGVLYCKMWYSRALLWGFMTTSSANLVVLTIERYISVAHPVFHRNKFTVNKAILVMVLAWVYGHFPHVVYGTWSFNSSDGECVAMKTTRAFRVYTGITFFVCLYLLPIVTMTICYIKIWMVLRVKTNPSDEHVDNRTKKMERIRRNVIKMLLIVVISFVICWSPNIFYVSVFHLILDNYVDFESEFYKFTAMITFCNMCINPFIYAAKYEEFQKELKFCCRNHNILTNSVSM